VTCLTKWWRRSLRRLSGAVHRRIPGPRRECGTWPRARARGGRDLVRHDRLLGPWR
jgi:hypothetical protein